MIASENTNVHPKTHRIVIGCITIYLIILVVIALTTNGTCDGGDSIMHYLYAKYAFANHENFLNHWAKPLFVLFSAPFAQFGFVGIKIFNCIVASATVLFVYLISTKLYLKRSWLAPLILAFTPGYFIHIFSGLTEPLFALFIIAGLYFLFSYKPTIGLIIFSFLPFVRSEGIIIIGIVAFYIIINKHYRQLVWLTIGHLLYSIIGYFHYHTLWWVFSKIPYIASSGKYGSGNILHYIIQLYYLLGLPIYILLLGGFILKSNAILTSFKKERRNKQIWLLYLIFIAFLSAHSLFWYFGLFESMGMKRVLICIIPIAALIGSMAIETSIDFIKNDSAKKLIMWSVCIYVIVFMFLPNPASVKWKKDLSLGEDQILINMAIDDIEKKYGKDVFVLATHPQVCLRLNKNPFDKKQFAELKDWKLYQSANKKVILIWDNWFAVIESNLSLNELKANAKFINEYASADSTKLIAVFELSK
jgi:Gpi18-like mannosyltransferase